MSAQGGGQAGDTPAPDLAAVWNPAAGGGSSAGSLLRTSPTRPVARNRDGAILRMGWTAEEVAQLEAWVAQRVTTREIARRLGRTFRSVEAKRYTLPQRVKTRRTAEELRVAVRMVREGKTARQIAAVLHRPRTTLDHWVKAIRKRLRERGAL